MPLYLHVGGHLHGKVVSLGKRLHEYNVAIPPNPVDYIARFREEDPAKVICDTPQIGRYRLVEIGFLNRLLEIYVSINPHPAGADEIADAVLSSAVKAVLRA